MDVKVCYAIGNLVEKLSTSGSQELDTKLYSELVKYAGQSEDYIKFCLEKLIQQMERKHSEIRLGAFLVIDELFRKSECFRELLLDEFPLLLELTVESNPLKRLPPPVPAAKILKRKALQAIQKWHNLFGEQHQKISLGYNFIKQNLKVDFNDALKRNAAELQKDTVERERMEKIMQTKLDELKIDIDDNVEEISRVITEMSNCFCLLIPKPEDLYDTSGSREITEKAHNESSLLNNQHDENDGEPFIDLREHGLSAANAVIPIKFDQSSRIQQTDDNFPVVENLKDLYSILKNRYFPLVKKWMQVASKAEHSSHFRRVMDVKEMIQSEMSRFEELNISSYCEQKITKPNEFDESDSDEDFEDVPEKDGYEAHAVAPALPCNNTEEKPSTSLNCRRNTSTVSRHWSLWNSEDNNAEDPTSLLATVTKMKEIIKQKEEAARSFTSKKTNEITNVTASKDSETKSLDAKETRKLKLLKDAPKLPFDIDLYHWEEDNLQAPSVEIANTDGHRFWQPSSREGETIEAPDGVASLRTRVIEFSGKFEPVKWSCRTPLPSGRLCPRKDRYKCPLHGKIIARDNMGNPTVPEDIAALAAEKEKIEREKPPEWQDPEFLKDIQAATGMDLTIRPPKKGKRKKTFAELYPSLTDTEKKKNDPRNRLEKKVLNKGSLKRVAATLDSLNYKKYKDKFGDQWNYSMNE